MSSNNKKGSKEGSMIQDPGAIMSEGFECDVMKYNLTTEKPNRTNSANIRGDNHKGYLGFRDATGSSRLISDNGDGAIYLDRITA